MDISNCSCWCSLISSYYSLCIILFVVSIRCTRKPLNDLSVDSVEGQKLELANMADADLAEAASNNTELQVKMNIQQNP